MQDEGVVAVAGGRRVEAGAAPEAAEGVLEALFPEVSFLRPGADLADQSAADHAGEPGARGSRGETDRRPDLARGKSLAAAETLLGEVVRALA